MARSVIVSAVRTPFAQARRRAGRQGGDRTRRDRDPRSARPRRLEGRRGRVRDHGPGAPGRRRPGARAAGGGRGGTSDRACPPTRSTRSAPQRPRRADRRPDDPRRRPQRRRRGRHGVDVERALHPEEGALRLPAGRRRADRPDDPRRADLELRPPHMVEQASFVSRELGISREDQDAWALRSHQRAVGGEDEGRFADEIVPVGELDGGREPAARHDARVAGAAEARVRPGRDDHRGQRAGRQRRRRRARRHQRGVREARAGSSCWRRSSPRPTSRTSSRISRGRRRGAGKVALDEGGQVDRRRQARRGQRGVLLGRAELDADARRRRGDGERQRRRGRARPSDRRVGRAGSSGR